MCTILSRYGEWISVDIEDEMVVNFYYPQIFEAEYLRSCVVENVTEEETEEHEVEIEKLEKKSNSGIIR